MKKEFIPYEEALALKELGFDEECFAVYNGDNIVYSDHNNRVSLNPNDYSNIFGEIILAPLYQQAFKWFRDKYNILGNVQNLSTHTTKHQFYAKIVEPITVSSYSIFDTYGEAELECLRKLIGIIKSNQNKDGK